MVRETWVQSQVRSYKRLKKWYLIHPCLTLGIIRYVSKVKWSNPGEGVAPSPTSLTFCSSVDVKTVEYLLIAITLRSALIRFVSHESCSYSIEMSAQKTKQKPLIVLKYQNKLIVVIYLTFFLCLDVAQDRINGAPNGTRTHSCRLTITPPEVPKQVESIKRARSTVEHKSRNPTSQNILHDCTKYSY